MKFKASILAFIITLASQLTLAGAETILKGKIIDRTSGEPEAGAVIQFFRADNMEKPVAYTITDVDGTFRHNIETDGEYILVFTNVGRKELRKSFSITGQDSIDLGEVLIEDDIEMLEAGKVVALKDLIKMDVDHITYKVADDIDARTSTLLDMLRKVPMVTVDAQDNISVNGSRSFQVLVDGKPNVMMSNNPAQVFKALPASFAKDIQVITNPGVKYDAEGVGGILNITTNKEMNATSGDLDGYNASITLGGGTTGVQNSGFVTVQRGKFSASGNVSMVEAHIPGATSEDIREQLDAMGNVISSVKTVSSSDLKAPVRLVSVNAGYEINAQNLVSATLGYNKVASHGTNTNDIEITSAGVPEIRYGSQTKGIWDVTSLTGGVDYQHTSKEHQDRLFTLSYLFSSSPSDTDSESIFGADMPGLYNRYTDGSTNTIQNTMQADYTTKSKNGWTFNAGAKYINRLNKSDQALFMDSGEGWKQDMTGSLIYRHHNDIGAGYAEASYGKGKLSGKGGIRYEHTFQNVKYKLGNGEDFRLDYGNLVPAASIQYNLGMTQNIGLTYNMRISRPGITYLNPYVNNSDPTVKSYGNSELETEKAHNLGLVYNYFSNKVILNATAHFNHTGNAIEAYNFYDSTGLLNTTYGNIASRNNTGITAMVIFNAGVNRLIINGGIDYNDIRSEALGLHNSGWSANALASYQTTLPWDLRFSSNLIWTSRTQNIDGWSTGLTMITGGLNKSILDGKLSFGVTGLAPITLTRCLVRETSSEGPDYRQYNISRVPMATIMGNITWNFGNNNKASVKKTRKTISNDDIKDMSNGSEGASSLISM